MENENRNEIETNEKDYLAEIENLKANTVPKEAYDKMKAENAKLIKTIATNQKIEFESKKPEMTHEQKVARHEELANSILKARGKQNIENAKNMIEFRKLTQELYGVDPATAKVMSENPAEDTQRLHERMDKVFDTLEKCVENADGSDKIFNRNLDDAIDRATYPRKY